MGHRELQGLTQVLGDSSGLKILWVVEGRLAIGEKPGMDADFHEVLPYRFRHVFGFDQTSKALAGSTSRQQIGSPHQKHGKPDQSNFVVRDSNRVYQPDVVDKAVVSIHEAVERCKRNEKDAVLLYCQRGRSRVSTMAVIYLSLFCAMDFPTMATKGLKWLLSSPVDAAYVKKVAQLVRSLRSDLRIDEEAAIDCVRYCLSRKSLCKAVRNMNDASATSQVPASSKTKPHCPKPQTPTSTPKKRKLSSPASTSSPGASARSGFFVAKSTRTPSTAKRRDSPVIVKDPKPPPAKRSNGGSDVSGSASGNGISKGKVVQTLDAFGVSMRDTIRHQQWILSQKRPAKSTVSMCPPIMQLSTDSSAANTFSGLSTRRSLNGGYLQRRAAKLDDLETTTHPALLPPPLLPTSNASSPPSRSPLLGALPSATPFTRSPSSRSMPSSSTSASSSRPSSAVRRDRNSKSSKRRCTAILRVGDDKYTECGATSAGNGAHCGFRNVLISGEEFVLCNRHWCRWHAKSYCTVCRAILEDKYAVQQAYFCPNPSCVPTITAGKRRGGGLHADCLRRYRMEEKQRAQSGSVPVGSGGCVGGESDSATLDANEPFRCPQCKMVLTENQLIPGDGSAGADARGALTASKATFTCLHCLQALPSALERRDRQQGTSNVYRCVQCSRFQHWQCAMAEGERETATENTNEGEGQRGSSFTLRCVGCKHTQRVYKTCALCERTLHLPTLHLLGPFCTVSKALTKHSGIVYYVHDLCLSTALAAYADPTPDTKTSLHHSPVHNHSSHLRQSLVHSRQMSTVQCLGDLPQSQVDGVIRRALRVRCAVCMLHGAAVRCPGTPRGNLSLSLSPSRCTRAFHPHCARAANLLTLSNHDVVEYGIHNIGGGTVYCPTTVCATR